MNDFLNNLVMVSGNEDATSVDSGLVSDIKGFISTGSYTLNALRLVFVRRHSEQQDYGTGWRAGDW